MMPFAIGEKSPGLSEYSLLFRGADRSGVVFSFKGGVVFSFKDGSLFSKAWSLFLKLSRNGQADGLLALVHLRTDHLHRRVRVDRFSAIRIQKIYQ